MNSIIVAVLLIGSLFAILVLSSVLNSRYKKDENVRGFKGNCESCGETSCAFHPNHIDEEE